MSRRSGRCAHVFSSFRSNVVLAFLLGLATFSSGQELKAAATTLGFSVRVLGPSGAQFLAPRVTQLGNDEFSSSVTVPLNNDSMRIARESATQVVARFRDDNANSRALTARVDGGEMQRLRPGETATAAMLVLPKEHLAGGTSSRNRILELSWKSAHAEDTSNILEIEIRQY
jgi:hypothetical protein